ncbi:MAG: DUF2505 domain-containing protein [Actinomycetia bacterium]|nr:DUF2505 domain-containing protein [Actinomycetes bacterium]
MKIDLDLMHPAPPVVVHAMLTDPQFHERKCAATGALEYQVRVLPAGGPDPTRTVVRTQRRLPTDGLPDLVRSFVKNGLVVRESIAWGPAHADGARVAEVDVQIVGQPVRMRGTLAMSPCPRGTAGHLLAELTVAVPLLGGAIEKLVAPTIVDAIRAEERVGRDWLAQAR